jgi:hypothetical protein
MGHTPPALDDSLASASLAGMMTVAGRRAA